MASDDAGASRADQGRASNLKLALVLAGVALAIYVGFVVSGLSRG